jgi:hypothetical protein
VSKRAGQFAASPRMRATLRCGVLSLAGLYAFS